MTASKIEDLNMKDTSEIHPVYQEPKKKKSQQKWEKTTNWCQYWDKPHVGTIKDFKVAMESCFNEQLQITLTQMTE